MVQEEIAESQLTHGKWTSNTFHWKEWVSSVTLECSTIHLPYTAVKSVWLDKETVDHHQVMVR